jgi:hypothetical protein
MEEQLFFSVENDAWQRIEVQGGIFGQAAA